MRVSWLLAWMLGWFLVSLLIGWLVSWFVGFPIKEGFGERWWPTRVRLRNEG